MKPTSGYRLVIDLPAQLRTLPTMEIRSERDYAAAWRTAFAVEGQGSPVEMAVAGGLLADNLSRVFIAGYQGALRATFPDTAFSGWAALVVSEDRSQAPLPGVTAMREHESGGYVLKGFKSWIAAVEHVDDLIVRAGGDCPGFYLVPRNTQGLHLMRNPAPSMLPELSQGRAAFNEVLLGQSARLNAARAENFSAVEAFHIYLAFIAMAWRLWCGEGNDAQAQACEDLLATAVELDPSTESAAMAELDKQVQRLRKTLLEDLFAQDQAWQRDKVLIAMYSRGLQAG